VKSAKGIDPDSIEPAPGPEFCDQNGIFYVSGYALRVQNDQTGSCWFLKNGLCRIYNKRFAICRVYPYMLHREPDDAGQVDWRQFSGLEQHGEYDASITEKASLDIARETKEYENAFLTQEIRFLEFIQDYFTHHKLRHVQKMYDDQIRQFQKGKEITVRVFFDDHLEVHRIRCP
jgi:uncharacterized protein